MTQPEAPRSVAAMTEALVAAGFEMAHTTSRESFGNQSLEFISSSLAVRAISDRGDWSVELSPGRDTGWFLAELWRQCIDGADPDPYAQSVDDAADFVASRLGHLQAVTEDETSAQRLIDCLLRAREARGWTLRHAIFGDREAGDP